MRFVFTLVLTLILCLPVQAQQTSYMQDWEFVTEGTSNDAYYVNASTLKRNNDAVFF